MDAKRPLRRSRGRIDEFFQCSLLAMVASGFGAILFSGFGSGQSRVLFLLSAGLLTGVALALVSRLLMVLFGAVMLPRWAVNLLVSVYFLVAPAEYLYLGRDLFTVVTHLVLFVAMVLLVTGWTPRDYLFLKVIALLEMLAASISSIDISYLVFLAVFLLATVAALTSWEILRAQEGRLAVAPADHAVGRRLAWLAGTVSLAILVLTGCLFFVLPRTARAALDRLLPPAQRISGFASEVTLGQVGEIRRQSTAVMHVQFGAARAEGLRWRGTALSEFNGLKWYNSNGRSGMAVRPDRGLVKLVDDDELRRPVPRFSYQVVLHNPGSDLLFLAGRPEHLRVPSTLVIIQGNGALRVPSMEPDGYRYVVYLSQWAPAAIPGRLTEDDRNFHLRLPPVDARIGQLAARITRGAKTDLERARAIENYLRTQFRYSLEPLEREVDDPLAHFLIESKKGHCEYFASAMAVMLRSVWVPSRVATGFLGGSFNPISGWQVVRASDAHSWVEAWVPGQGWMTFDPTPSDPAAPPDAFSRLSLWADAISVFWQEWVLGYDLDRQLTLAFEVEQKRRRVSFDWAARGWKDVPGEWTVPAARWLLVPLVLVVVGLGFWKRKWLTSRLQEMLARRRLRQGVPAGGDASRIYCEMLDALRRRGFEKARSATPAEFARTLAPSDRAEAVAEFTALYNALRFGGEVRHGARLAALLDRIERLP